MTSRAAPSCVRCAERKVKCDRKSPCGPCTKHNVQCEVPVFKPSKRREKRLKQEILEERIKQYESLLSKQASSNGSPADFIPKSPAEAVSEAVNMTRMFEWDKSITKTQLLNFKGSPNFVDNSLLSRVAEEFDGMEGDHTSSPVASEDDLSEDGIEGVIMGTISRSQTKHPCQSHILSLWKSYCDNIDPLTKLVHTPTLRPLIERAAQDTSCISKNLEALMFAIYSNAILSLDEQECQARFLESRIVLLHRYISATKRSLARAHFLASTSIVVLQALSLHIIAIRDSDEPRVVWNLVGLALRMAEGIGLDKNGEDYGLSVFESECRRRISWFIKFHGARSAELCGLPKFANISSLAQLKVLADVDDDELFPEMTSLPENRERITDSVFCSSKTRFVRDYAFRTIAQQQGTQGGLPSPEQRGEIEEDMKNMYELEYFRYMDPTKPLHLLMTIYIRYSQNVYKLLSNHPRSWVGAISDSKREEVWNTCMEMFEQFLMMQTSPHIQKYAWATQYYFQWHALIHVLDVLRATPNRPQSEEAWSHIDRLFTRNPEFITNVKRPIYLAVGQLCLKAFDVKEKSNPFSIEVPDFITKLRQVNIRRANKHTTAQHPAPPSQIPMELETDFSSLDFEMSSDFWSSFNDANQPIDWSQWDNLVRM